ncbi:hypothetical protein MGYG_06833 [Nannizzia gypsea CBS 118893]|uniref:Uncharacterized protein n=1 Tax=Arthroderma gypseum (strain ATCC MYA-4604 / CBS 118893) TaxID=535722 RepID=E4V1B9_ARTGP|nr:hypothetical protein MGYG_06833 [Nannizzia gypsea CBS 118893]EFR03834.1 hypothetical protein MGYG_06833 [Nannizzia gypsea CBS 118893]
MSLYKKKAETYMPGLTARCIHTRTQYPRTYWANTTTLVPWHNPTSSTAMPRPDQPHNWQLVQKIIRKMARLSSSGGTAGFSPAAGGHVDCSFRIPRHAILRPVGEDNDDVAVVIYNSHTYKTGWNDISDADQTVSTRFSVELARNPLSITYIDLDLEA